MTASMHENRLVIPNSFWQRARMAGLLDPQYARLHAAFADPSTVADRASLLRFAAQARQAARTDLGIALLDNYLNQNPNDREARFCHAQLRYESGLPSAQLFAEQLRQMPNDLQLVAATAAALDADGNSAEAEEVLNSAIVKRPDWIDGHRSLAALRWQQGAAVDGFADSFRLACAAQPQNRALWLAWFHLMAQAKGWAAASAIIAEAEHRIGEHLGFILAKLFLASESGDDQAAEQLFQHVSDVQDVGLDLCRVRFGLRHGRLDWAERAALRLLATPAAQNAWPYLSLIWRLNEDARAQWLDAPDQTIKVYELPISAAEIGELSALLAALHTNRHANLDQSVRGGTQTHRQLFFRHEPIIALLKTKIRVAVADYVASLPPFDPQHPLLAAARTSAPYFAGSWSVRLSAGGFHVGHNHPLGWVSSAFYVALPALSATEPTMAGCISFGSPPTELGLALQPYQRIEPKVGRLVLFPSTMWHSTETFNAGERLVVAFDLSAPRHLA